MYFDKVKLSVKSSNYESIAKFSSTLDDAHLLVVANNCNDYSFNDYANAGIFGAHTNRLVDRYEAFVGTKENHVLNKIAVFNREQIDLNTNTIVSGNIIPSSNIVYDLGSDTQRWKDLYLSGQTISLGNTIIKSDSTTNSFSISDDTNSPLTMIAGEYKILAEDKTELSLQIKDNSLFVNTTNPAGDVISELNISEMNTNTMIEGSNLFYTHSRVANIIDGSNVHTCNYIKNTSNVISTRITETSNAIEGRLTVTSNAIEGRLTETSNAIEGRLTVTSNAIEGRLTDTSNAIEGRLTDTSNAIEGRLTETSNRFEGRLTDTSNEISTRVTLLSTDQITEHQNAINRFIVNNEYDGDIRITGELRTSNLIVYGKTTTIETDNYTAEVLNIESSTDYAESALSVNKIGEDNNVTSIFETTYNNNIVAKIDTKGVLFASNFSGDGSMITNVRLADNTTDQLTEGTSNLYFTDGRVATIIDSSNVHTCNYIRNTSNVISTRITETSNAIEGRLTVTSNAIEGRLTDTSNAIEGRLTVTSNAIEGRLTETSNAIEGRLTDTSNAIEGRLTETSNRFEGRLTDLDNEITTYLQNLDLDQVHQGTSNKYIYNNVWDDNLYITGRLMVTDIEIADLEEILAQEGTGNIGNFYTYIDTVAKKSVETTIDDKMNNTGDITTSNINVMGNIIPTSNEQFDLGSIDKRWRDLYLSGNTINMGGSKISLDTESEGFSFKNQNNELIEVITSSVKIVDKATNKTIRMKSKDNKISFVEDVNGVEEEVAAMNDIWTSNSDNIQYGNIKIFNDKIERVTDTGAIIPYTDQEILFDNSSIINFTGSDVISNEQTSGVYDTTLVPHKRSTRDNSKFYKIFDVTIVSESRNLIFSSVLYRNYQLISGDITPIDLTYHVVFSYYSLSKITVIDKGGNDCISFDGNELWFVDEGTTENLHVSLKPNYTISIVSR